MISKKREDAGCGEKNGSYDWGFFVKAPRVSPKQEPFELWHYHRDDGGPAIHYIDSELGVTLDAWMVFELGSQMLHRLDGPAVVGGLKDQEHPCMFWGVRVPKEWTAPGGLTVDAILGHSNAEVRRVGIRAFGAEKFAAATHKKTLDLRVGGEAPDAVVELRDKSRWLVCTDGSSGRSPYYLRLPDDVKTCAEAQVALNGQMPARVRT